MRERTISTSLPSTSSSLICSACMHSKCFCLALNHVIHPFQRFACIKLYSAVERVYVCDRNNRSRSASEQKTHTTNKFPKEKYPSWNYCFWWCGSGETSPPPHPSSIYFCWINTSASESEYKCSTVVTITHINTRAHNLEFGICASMVSVNKARSRKTHANKLILNIHPMHVDKDQLIIKLFIWEFSH